MANKYEHHKSEMQKKENGFVFTITAFNLSIVLGLIVMFLISSTTIQTTIGGKSFAYKSAYWKAISKISMLEQLIKDYGFSAVSNGSLVSDVSFEYVDDCHRRVVSEINTGLFKQVVEGLLENENCEEVNEFPNYSMIYKVEDSRRRGRGFDHGWRRHHNDDHNQNSWGWRQGTGDCEDVWGWNWQFPCEQDTLIDTLVYFNEYGEFLVTGEQGTLDGFLYVGADIIFDYTFTNSLAHIGENPDYLTHLKIPETSTVVPGNPIDQNHYTWETVSALDLPDFDHHAYDSLLATAEGISHNPNNGKFVGDVNWPYDGQWDETNWFHLQNYIDRTMYVNGDCQIQYCEIENIGGDSNEPGIIVATGNITIDTPLGEFIPDNIILISGGDVQITGANFGSVMNDEHWGSVVNEIYARGSISLIGEDEGNRIFAQTYAFETDNMGVSVELNSVDFYGLIYAPNSTGNIDMAADKWFKGAMYANQIKDDRFENNYLVLNHRFPSHYLEGGMVGIYQDTENWVLVTGSIREI
ncbi:MAG: hypothetical protein HQ510_09565 [Candidatus Marinimicrobia bacterium]|nr:hypothetical protein [Candidatus Neomarinimicrobiota bacterium]